jgi:adenosylhomocysteinase
MPQVVELKDDKKEELIKLGRERISWAQERMPVLSSLREELKGLDGIQIGACLHVTKETAVLMLALKSAGAQISLCGSNPLSTQDDVALALVEDGIDVYAWREQSEEDYRKCIDAVLAKGPEITMDDGGDLTVRAHELGLKAKGGTEETTTGVKRLKALMAQKGLLYPVVAANDAYMKYLFDNRYGTGQSSIDGLLRGTSILLAGKKFVVCGYGWVGRGIAMRARGMGSKVIVTEVDPIRALEAHMDGYEVMPIQKAAEIGDIFLTATGDKDVISGKEMEKMKDDVFLANSGHFDVEVDVEYLREKGELIGKRGGIETFLIGGKRINLLGEGRLVNLALAEGHPPEVMDMSFAVQALSVQYLETEKLDKEVLTIPRELDEKIARMKLKAEGIEIDELTEEQAEYLKSFR